MISPRDTYSLKKSNFTLSHRNQVFAKTFSRFRLRGRHFNVHVEGDSLKMSIRKNDQK